MLPGVHHTPQQHPLAGHSLLAASAAAAPAPAAAARLQRRRRRRRRQLLPALEQRALQLVGARLQVLHIAYDLL
jgi:hypothetical protein